MANILSVYNVLGTVLSVFHELRQYLPRKLTLLSLHFIDEETEGLGQAYTASSGGSSLTAEPLPLTTRGRV